MHLSVECMKCGLRKEYFINKYMNRLAAITLGLMISISAVSNTEWQSRAVNQLPVNEIKTVGFCDLLDHPQAFDQQIIRTTAIYRYGGEDLSNLYCPECLSLGSMRPKFSDETCTKRRVRDKLSIQKRSDGTVRVVVVGRFHGTLSNLEILCIERADLISTDSRLPDRMSPKDRKRVRCC